MCKQHALRIAWTIARSIAFLDFRVLRWKFTYDWKCVNTTYRVPLFCPLPASRKGLRLTLRSALFGEGGRDWRPWICKLGCTVKPVYNGHSKIDKTKILMTNGSSMKVKSFAECSPWSILQYFWPALSNNWSWKPIFCLFEGGCSVIHLQLWAYGSWDRLFPI